MLRILANRHIATLREFASSNVLVAFDFDGTLAPIVRDPARAAMRPMTRRLLTEVARRYPCVVISGRARQDLIKRVGSVPVFHLAGNYGLEPWDEDPVHAARVQRWILRLRKSLAGHTGVTIEDKTYSLTIHFRRAQHPRVAQKAINAAVGAIRDARRLEGSSAISLLPRNAPAKGEALERVRLALSCGTAIYVGDDETDEDAFASGAPEALLAIRVGAQRPSRARYRLRNQDEIDALLRALLRFRPVRSGRSSSANRTSSA